jgi:hypothetical protein
MRKASLLIIPLTFFAASSLWERLAAFANLRHPGPYNSKYFYMNNHYYLGFFDVASRKYIVYRFDEKGSE